MKSDKVLKSLFCIAAMTVIASQSNAQKIKVSILGDSNTAGFAHADAVSIHAKTAQLLGTNFNVVNRGHSSYCLRSGCNLSYAAAESLVMEAVADKADYYVIALGTNDGRFDVKQNAINWPVHSAENLQYAKEDFVLSYERLIARLRQGNPSAIVILATSPKIADTEVTRAYGHSDANVSGGVVPLIRLVGLRANANVIDVNPLTDNMQDLAGDGVHLNERGAYKYGVSIRDAICQSPSIPLNICPLKNIASDGIASQSSTYLGVTGPDFAKFAVDGSASSNYVDPATPHQSHTNFDLQPWLDVDLKGVRFVHSIKFTPRTDNGAWQRNSALYVLTSTTPFASNRLNVELSRAGVRSYYFPNASQLPTELKVESENQSMRYVRIWLGVNGYLSVAELEIFEQSVPPRR